MGQNPLAKVYYNCPGCDARVWAFPAYVGNRCWGCPGTIFHAIVKTTPVLRQAETIIDTQNDNKTKYSCSGCGADVWAYGQFAGQKCWECKTNGPISFIGGMTDITKAL